MKLLIVVPIIALSLLSLAHGDAKKGKLKLKSLCKGIGCQFCTSPMVKKTCAAVCRKCDAGKREDPILDQFPDSKGPNRNEEAKKKMDKKKKGKEAARKKKEQERKKKEEEKKQKEAEEKKKKEEERKKKEEEEKKKQEEERKKKQEAERKKRDEDKKKKEEERKKKEDEKKKEEEKKKKEKEKAKKEKEAAKKTGKIPLTPQGDKDADAKFDQCCQKKAKPCSSANAAVCHYGFSENEIQEGMSKGCNPFKHLAPAITCAADGRDNTKCCKDSGVQSKCFKFCHSPKSISFGDLGCRQDLKKIVQCHRKNVEY